MEYVLMIHSLVRWLIILIAVVAIIKFALGWQRGQKFEAMDRGLQSGFSGVMDLQMLLGLILLIGGGVTGEGFPLPRIIHAVIMTAAVVTGHLPARWRQAPDALRFRNALFCIVAALALIVVGVIVVVNGGQ